ncbi:type II toxin-antitoxin system RelE/ParE family toxin [Methylococcus sp. Mc7]|uniref:type II toxin-antitoxin system RelE/ParE family toxin n=1 Tax=Methylococcus sp. Mc7 TaxID=2860258 RepID=UPI0021030914|nr:type II toxin-antitoxin system RelE/ParE family toxin [Methylococcus sp. Mc7]
MHYTAAMIRSFKHQGLSRCFTDDDHRGINPKHAARIRRLLDRMDAAAQAEDMNLPGFGVHGLAHNRAGGYAVTVSGNWRITFRFEDGHAFDVNLGDDHR